MDLKVKIKFKTKIFICIFILCIINFFTSTKSFAGIPELYGFGPQGISLASGGSSVVDDFSAVYYNPAQLTEAKAGFAFGVVHSFDFINISLMDRKPGVDISDKIYDSEPMENPAKGYSFYPIPTSKLPKKRRDINDLDNNYGFFIGYVQNFGLKNFSMGFGFYLPADYIQQNKFHYIDEREQFFSNNLDYGLLFNSAKNLNGYFGFAYKPLKSIRLGFSVDFYQSAYTTAHVYIPDALHTENFFITLDTDVESKFSYIAALSIDLTAYLRFSTVYHNEKNNSIDNKNFTSFWNYQIEEGKDYLIQDMSFNAQYIPASFTSSFSYYNHSLSMSFDLAYYLWENYITFHKEQPNVKFSNTLSFKTALKWKYNGKNTILAGIGYEPDPVPLQTGRSNFVYNTRIVSGLGLSIPLKFLNKNLDLNLYSQVQFLPLKKNIKDPDAILDEFPDSRNKKTEIYVEESKGLQTNNPGYPGFSSEGFIGILGFSVNYLF